jgi:6-phosphogluconate dehydrogenase (decarboxylating)
MKVGLIGLGRMGEGMSRRMMKSGIEVWGYRRNYEKAQEAFEKGYVSGVSTTIENLVKVVKQTKNVGVQPGIFQMVVPAETVEETINELLRYCGKGDIIIDLLGVFTVWIVDTVLWLEVEILRSPLVRAFLMPSPQVSTLPPGLNLTQT